MRVRVTQVDGTGVDLNRFKFDYFATWFAFFMNAKGHLYARYGEGWGRLKVTSLAGLKSVMKNVLEIHKKDKNRKPDPPLPRKAVYPENLPSAKRMLKREGCLHCHHIWRAAKKDMPALVTFSYKKPPMPDAVGLSLDVDLGNVVKSVRPMGRAAKAGIRTGDVIQEMDGTPIFSAADVSWFLMERKQNGPIAVVLRRGGRRMQVKL